MQGIEVIATGQRLPDGILDNEKLSTMMDTSDEWIATRTGIKSRRVCMGTDDTCNSLALGAAREAIERAKSLGEDPESHLCLLTVSSLTPDYAIPSTACMVKEALGLPDTVMSFDMNAACSGFLYGLQVAHAMLATMPEGAMALVIGSEQLSRVMDYSNASRGTSILFGDGAGAALIRLSKNKDNIFYAKSWSHGDRDALYCPGVGESPAYVSMDGPKVFKFAVQAFEQGLNTMLELSGLTLDDIDMIVPHQANLRIIDHAKKRYPDHAHKVYVNIQDHGNSSAGSVPVAFDDLFSTGRIKNGQKVLCVAFGAGLTWSATLFTV